MKRFLILIGVFFYYQTHIQRWVRIISVHKPLTKMVNLRVFLFSVIFITKELTMRKIIRLTESDLTRIVKRLINEKKDMIKIPKEYDGVRMELGNSASPEDIIDMYNELVASEGDSSRLEKYEDDYFWNDSMDEITVDVILDELNYSINGGEDDEDYESPVSKTGKVGDNEFVFSDTTTGSNKIIFNPKMNRYEFQHRSKNGGGSSVLTDERMKSLLDFLTKRK